MTVALCTSYYAGYRPEYGVAVRTSVGSPRWWEGDLEHIRRISPYGVFGEAEGAEYERRYIERLDQIDLESLAQRFAEISARHDSRPLVLLCFERDPADCHRSMLARWLEARGFGPVPEAGESDVPSMGQMTLGDEL